ncbi:aspartic peptidase domain-containing protein [Melanogaster broomeanus]|nr:aspartic peptidase domain-containing protein [Melanogaster broomeanus]
MRFTLIMAMVTVPFLVVAAPSPQPVKQKSGTAIPIRHRSRLINDDKTVNIEAAKSHLASSKACFAANLNFEKNTGTPHPSVVEGAQKRAAGGNALTADENVLWYGTIAVGTPPVNYKIDFDTGSSDFFLPGVKCGPSCEGHKIYDESASSTAIDLGKTFSFAYGDGSNVEGDQYNDTVAIVGVTATDQTLGVASQYSTKLKFDYFPPDGLMGMAFQSISQFNAMPVFQTLLSQGVLDEPVFAFKLATTGPGPELYIGGTNPIQYMGDITYTAVTQQGHWQVNMDNIIVNGQTLLRNLNSIIGTGTTYVTGPRPGVDALYQAIGGSDASALVAPGFYTFPCQNEADISFTFGGASFGIPEFNLGYIAGHEDACLGSIIAQDGLANDNAISAFWVIGGSFLNNVYSVFDVGGLRVGFANLENVFQIGG